MLDTLRTHISLLMQSPKDYLYSFKYSGKKKVIKINPFNPYAYKSAEALTNKIRKVCPILNLYLIGSTGLQIEGTGDIDLYATAPISEFDDARKTLTDNFGQPFKVRKNFMEWKFYYNSFPVELKLRSPKDKYFQMQVFLFNLIKGNQVYLAEYKRLKRSLNDGSKKDYARRRMEFFNRILREANFN